MSKILVTPDTMTAAFTSLSSIQQDQFRSALFPTQGGNSGRFLTTNGSTVYGVPQLVPVAEAPVQSPR